VTKGGSPVVTLDSLPFKVTYEVKTLNKEDGTLATCSFTDMVRFPYLVMKMLEICASESVLYKISIALKATYPGAH
jgi:hypothetical protein